jgi:hypothetical protein
MALSIDTCIFKPWEAQMSGNNTSGTILIRENTLLPAGLAVESEVFLPGWRVVKNLDRSTLARNIEAANWTFFCLAREIRATVFGIDEEKMVRRAIKEILARLKSEKFNSLEITRVTSVASKRFLEVRYVTVSAQSGLIQQGVGLVPAKDSVLRMPAAPNGQVAAKQYVALISSS